jgi:DNA ligase-1
VTLLADVVRTSAQVGATSSRLAKTAALAERLRSLERDEIEIAIAYLSGELRQGKLALGYRTLRPAAPAATATLTLRDVDAAFEAIKAARGRGSGSQRAEMVDALFGKATAEEQDFLVRLIVGELHQGALDGVMLEALAAASGLPAALVRRATMIGGGIGPVARAALTQGQAGLARFAILPMRPVLPMLAQPAATPQAALEALGEAAFEWKLDGARVQVHKAGEEVRVFTRTLKDITAAVPEVVAAAREAASASLILDGEAIALRPDGRPHPFQTTMRRLGRKADDASLRDTLPVSVFFFDCLYHEEPLVDRPLRDRRRVLEEVIPAKTTRWVVTGDPATAESFYQEALSHGHEGVMAKALDAPYEAGRRGSGWLKVKRSHTLDLVVIAAEWGHGRRKGWLSNLHLAARDPAGGFVMLGKTFKGMTDVLLEWQTRELQARALESDDRVVHVRPELVVEIEFSDIQKSPHYPVGLALRLARVKRYRPDKRPEDADTIDTVRSIHEQGLG